MNTQINLITENNQILVSSRQVAEDFEQAHKNTLQTIKNLTAENSAVRSMFFESEYINSRGRKYKEYLMNRDGFSLLAMGFTGKKALQWKLKYIEAFNEMEYTIKNGLQVSEKDKLHLALFSGDAMEVAQAHKKLVEMEVAEASAPLLNTIEEQAPKVAAYDEYIETDGTYTSMKLGKKLGFNSAQAFNKFLHENKLIFKNGKSWLPYATLPKNTYKLVPFMPSYGYVVETLRFTPAFIDYLRGKGLID